MARFTRSGTIAVTDCELEITRADIIELVRSKAQSLSALSINLPDPDELDIQTDLDGMKVGFEKGDTIIVRWQAKEKL